MADGDARRRICAAEGAALGFAFLIGVDKWYNI